MSKREKDWARRRRSMWIELLGGKCIVCGTTENLEFDCIVSQGDSHHKKDTSSRMSFYHKQIRKKNLQLLCHFHNALKGNMMDSVFKAIYTESNEPF